MWTVALGGQVHGPDLGAWYASAELRITAFELAHHLRREAVVAGFARIQRDYRTYTVDLAGSYLDIRGLRSEVRALRARELQPVAGVWLGCPIRRRHRHCL